MEFVFMDVMDEAGELWFMDSWLDYTSSGGSKALKDFAYLIKLAGDNLDLDSEFVCFDCSGIPYSMNYEEAEDYLRTNYYDQGIY